MCILFFASLTTNNANSNRGNESMLEVSTQKTSRWKEKQVAKTMIAQQLHVRQGSQKHLGQLTVLTSNFETSCCRLKRILLEVEIPFPLYYILFIISNPKKLKHFF